MRPEQHALIRKLEPVLVLSDEDRKAVLALPILIQTIPADRDITREGDRPSRCCLIVEGFAATYKMTDRGVRQTMAFHIPGDVPDLQSLHLEVLDMSLGTLTECKVGFIRHQALDDLCGSSYTVSKALWRETLVHAAIFREWVLNVGGRDAHSALAHLLCEFVARMKAVGLAEGNVCEFPQTQEELGDALGISTVHVNRTLMELRGAGLITLKGGILAVLNCEGLKAAGGFDPTYLHLRPQAA
jgi:CRP-like cAMP-binding protein